MKHQASARSQTRAVFALVGAFVFIAMTVGSAGEQQGSGQPDTLRLNQPGKDVQWYSKRKAAEVGVSERIDAGASPTTVRRSESSSHGDLGASAAGLPGSGYA